MAETSAIFDRAIAAATPKRAQERTGPKIEADATERMAIEELTRIMAVLDKARGFLWQQHLAANRLAHREGETMYSQLVSEIDTATGQQPDEDEPEQERDGANLVGEVL